MSTTPEAPVAVLVAIEGRVQGVGYRAWCLGKARASGLSGWVRNRRTGEVEAVFSGPRSAVEAMIADCKDGPPGAFVSQVRRLRDTDPVAGGFDIAPTV